MDECNSGQGLAGVRGLCSTRGPSRWGQVLVEHKHLASSRTLQDTVSLRQHFFLCSSYMGQPYKAHMEWIPVNTDRTAVNVDRTPVNTDWTPLTWTGL